jgi:5-formyltetrahydrofolate cyclo-ligase
VLINESAGQSGIIQPVTGNPKTAARKQAREILRAMTPVDRAAASREICLRLISLPQWRTARLIALYSAMETEPDLRAAMETAGAGKRFCFPRINGDVLDFHICTSAADFTPGHWDLLEPGAHCERVPAHEIDLIAIPGLAFTRAGGRLGRGGGFYDRFLLAAHPQAWKAGICFERQILPTLPREAHDHEVDIVITEVSPPSLQPSAPLPVS